MKIILNRKTTWGCLRYFTLYKNGERQGKLFTNVPVEIDATVGDILTFQEGWFQFSRHIEVLPDMKEITIINSKKLQQLFFICLTLFFILSLLFLSIPTFSTFLIAEALTFVMLNLLFRRQSYQFVLKKRRSKIPIYSQIV